MKRKIKFIDYKWFEGKMDFMLDGAANIEERQHRLKWLAEGSLEYHLTKFKSNLPPVKAEIDLYNEFIIYIESKETLTLNDRATNEKSSKRG